MRVRLNSNRLIRMILADVLVDLRRAERLALLVIAKEPQPRRLVILVVRDGEVVRARGENVVVGADVGRGVRGGRDGGVGFFDEVVVKIKILKIRDAKEQVSKNGKGEEKG